MARVTTSGEVIAAQAAAPALPATATVHVGLPLESFATVWNGCCITMRQGVRFSAETGLKTALQATDKAITWES